MIEKDRGPIVDEAILTCVDSTECPEKKEKYFQIALELEYSWDPKSLELESIGNRIGEIMARGLSHQDCEDGVQDVLKELWTKMPGIENLQNILKEGTYQPGVPRKILLKWIGKTARRIRSGYIRRMIKSRKEFDLGDIIRNKQETLYKFLQISPSVLEKINFKEIIKILWLRLTQKEQDVLPFLEEDLDYKEIAEKLDISEAAARKRIYRIKQKGKKLRQEVEVKKIHKVRSHHKPCNQKKVQLKEMKEV